MRRRKKVKSKNLEMGSRLHHEEGICVARKFLTVGKVSSAPKRHHLQEPPIKTVKISCFLASLLLGDSLLLPVADTALKFLFGPRNIFAIKFSLFSLRPHTIC